MTTSVDDRQEQQERTTTSVDAPAEIQRQIAERLEGWRQAFETKDVEGLMSYYVDGDAFSAFDLMAPIEFRGGDMWRQAWVSFLGAYEGSLKLDLLNVRTYAGGNLAVVRCFVRLRGTIAGHDSDSCVRVTIGLALTDGQWMMFHDHVSVPIDLSSGQALLTLSPDHPMP